MTLAERCEQATGTDRALDSEIAEAMGWTDCRYEGYGTWRGIPPGESKHRAILGYTRSLDAAETLVPEGETGGRWWKVTHGTQTSSAEVRIHYFQSSRYDHKPPAEFEGKMCANAALALSAAALRAQGVTK